MATGTTSSTTKVTTSSESTGAPTTGESSDAADVASAGGEVDQSTSERTSDSSDSGKTIATYKPGLGIPGVRREISKKDAKSALSVDLEEDLVWERSNNHRVDVSNVPSAFLEMLKKDKDFKISSE